MKDAFAKEQKPLESCQAPSFSFYQLIDDLWHQGGNPNPLHRLCTLMRKMKVKSFIREELELNEELLEEQNMATRRCKQKVSLTATRLTFFRSLPSPLKWDDPDELPPDDHLLGYAVIATLKLPDEEYRTYLLESVVRPPSIWMCDAEDGISIEPITNYYVHNTRDFETTIGTEEKSRTFTLLGSFFAQQNDITHVCAHAALRMAINSSSTLTTEKLTNQRINEILGIDFSSPEKCVGHIDGDPPETKTGLNYQELETVVRQLGGRTVSADFVQNTSVEYDQFIYPFVESACPVILGIEGWNFSRSSIISHVVSVLGHTLNSDRWEPEARSGYGGFPAESYTPVTAWVGHYIINDDNFGMYVTLPSDMLRNYLVPSKNPNLHATRAIAIVPSGVQLSGLLAEGMAVSFVQSLARSEWMDQFVIFLKQTGLPVIWLKRLAQQSDKIVSRTLLQTKSSYRQYIDGLVQRDQVTLTPEIRQRFENMPEHIWVSEITLPHLYTGNKHKLGDVIIDANATDEEHSAVESFELAWFPGFIYFGSDHQIFPWNVHTHVPLIREEETIPLLEW